MNLNKNNAGKILLKILPIFVFFFLSLSYLVFQRQAESYSGASCGYSDPNNPKFFRPCTNTNMCIKESCEGASPDVLFSIGTCEFSGYNLTPPEGQGDTWAVFNKAHPTMPLPYTCDCSGTHYRNGRCEPYLGENDINAPMDCMDGLCEKGEAPPRRFKGTSYCEDRIIAVACTTSTSPSMDTDGCCPNTAAFAAGDPDCCPPPAKVSF